MRCRNCDIYRAHTGSSTSGGKHRTSHCRVREKCRQKTVHPLAFSLVSHALSACSAQKLAAIVLEEELDATSPVLGGASFTQSPVGLETSPAAVFGVVGASST